MTSEFDKCWAAMGLGEHELRQLQNILIEEPDAGDVIQGLSGARKIRVSIRQHGKSGGGRVIYVDIAVKERIYLLLAYPKNVQADLNSDQRKNLKSLIEYIKEVG